MPILSDEAIAAFTGLGHKLRRERTKFSTTSQLLTGTNSKLPPLKVKIKVPPMRAPDKVTRQQRRAMERKAKG